MIRAFRIKSSFTITEWPMTGVSFCNEVLLVLGFMFQNIIKKSEVSGNYEIVQFVSFPIVFIK